MELCGNHTWRSGFFVLLFFVIFFVPANVAKTKTDLVQRIVDSKDFKKFVKTHTNVLVVFAKSEQHVAGSWEVFAEVAVDMKGLASVVFIDCSADKKLCKKLKSSTESFELKHFKDGEFHKIYDRKMTVKSLTNFLRDPSGEIPWEEDSTAMDVFHLNSRAALSKLLAKDSRPLLVMFYAPWCGYCKKLKPEYAAAATELKGGAILAGIDVDKPENAPLRTEFNISGFPTLVYFESGHMKYRYGGENTKDGIVKWMKSPAPPKEPEKEVPWSETDTDVVHLTDATFDDFISSNPSVLIMFYAPWCGHCKKMKPEYEKAAAQLKEDKIAAAVAAVDATSEKQIAGRFQIKGYPTVKYFRDGAESWDFNERTSEKIIEFLKNPQEPPPPPVPELKWEDVEGYVKHLNEDDFKPFTKKKKHTLVMFYAPWCGHCKNAKPHFSNAAEQFKDDTKVAFAAVDCTKYADLCSVHDVSGYPTFKYFNYGKNDQKYTGGREEADFAAFMANPMSPSSTSTPPAAVSGEKSWSDIPGYDNVLHLNEKELDHVIQQHQSVLVMFYAPWCMHCTAMKPAYAEAATLLKKEEADGVLAAVDVTVERNLQSRFSIKGFPTIKFFKSGLEAFDYDRGRSVQDFVDFMRKPTQLTPAPNWMSEPGYIHHLAASNFSSFLVDKQRVVVMFYAPWCQHCLQVKPHFWEVAELLKNTNTFLAALDCTEPTNGEVCFSNGVKGYPSFKFFQNSIFVAEYEGNRTTVDLLDFIKKAPTSREEL